MYYCYTLSMTFQQQVKKDNRIEKRSKSRSPQLRKCPQKKGICKKVYTTAPKKPNSAVRRIAKVWLSTKKFTIAYIPGTGGSSSLSEFSTVIIRGGRVPDLPGVKYRCIRGAGD